MEKLKEGRNKPAKKSAATPFLPKEESRGDEDEEVFGEASEADETPDEDLFGEEIDIDIE